MKDNLQLAHRRKKTIKTLVAYIRSMRAWIKENDILHQEREKELLHAISVSNRRIKKLEKQVINYRSDKQLKHLQYVVETRGLKILELNKKINQYEMEKL